MRMLESLTDPLTSLLFPQTCHVCGGPVNSGRYGVACENCWEQAALFKGNENLCYKCGLLQPGSPKTSDKPCTNCREMHFDRAASAGIYSGALAASIIRLKEVPVICRQVREVLINTSSRSDLRPDVLIPVPLSSRRRLERGFNQAEILADALARFSKISMDPLSLERTVHTQTHRVAMDHKARAASVKNAFRVTRPHLIEGRNVLLIDDLLTSGATASICAEVLKNAGAAMVNVLTLARAARRT